MTVQPSVILIETENLEEETTNKSMNESMNSENELLPLVTFTDDDRIEFNEQVARITFANARYRGKKISIVSVMGPSRSGKSFMMSILQNEMIEHTIRGSFKSGYERHTEGILIFRKPLTIASDHFVFFIDTQGTFDLQTDRNISSWIAGFSLLISDVQVLNIRGNVGGDDLHDLRTFVETAAACPQSNLTKNLIFVIRDAAEFNDQNNEEYLDNLWAQCEKSKDLQETSGFLRLKFPNRIQAFCVPPASEHLRRANGFVDLQPEDLPLLNRLKKVKEFVIQRCVDSFQFFQEDSLSNGQKIVHYLENGAPKLRSTVKVIQEASIMVAVNKSLEIFKKCLRNASTSEELKIQEVNGRNEAEDKMKEMINKKDLEEAGRMLEGKIQEVLLEKKKAFQLIEKEKKFRQETDKFLAKWRTKLQKIMKLEEIRKIQKDDEIRKNAQETLKIDEEIARDISKNLLSTLENRNTVLKTQFVKEMFQMTCEDFRKTLLQRDSTSIPSNQDLNSELDRVLVQLKTECIKQEFSSQEWEKAEPQLVEELQKILLTSKEMLEKRLKAQEELDRLNELYEKERETVKPRSIIKHRKSEELSSQWDERGENRQANRRFIDSNISRDSDSLPEFPDLNSPIQALTNNESLPSISGEDHQDTNFLEKIMRDWKSNESNDMDSKKASRANGELSKNNVENRPEDFNSNFGQHQNNSYQPRAMLADQSEDDFEIINKIDEQPNTSQETIFGLNEDLNDSETEVLPIAEDEAPDFFKVAEEKVKVFEELIKSYVVRSYTEKELWNDFCDLYEETYEIYRLKLNGDYEQAGKCANVFKMLSDKSLFEKCGLHLWTLNGMDQNDGSYEEETIQTITAKSLIKEFVGFQQSEGNYKCCLMNKGKKILPKTLKRMRCRRVILYEAMANKFYRVLKKKMNNTAICNKYYNAILVEDSKMLMNKFNGALKGYDQPKCLEFHIKESCLKCWMEFFKEKALKSLRMEEAIHHFQHIVTELELKLRDQQYAKFISKLESLACAKKGTELAREATETTVRNVNRDIAEEARVELVTMGVETVAIHCSNSKP